MTDAALGLLRQTSRSFYLSLRILPRATRATVGLAYLLARAADSIADTKLVGVAERRALLDGFGAALEGRGRPDYLKRLKGALDGSSRDAERQLLDALPSAFGAADGLGAPDREDVIGLLGVIVGGMQLDLTWFPGALDTHEQLDRYTYHVAGVVGEFWTAVHARHIRDVSRLDLDEMARLGTRYGKGLQLVNILRDLPRDLANGRCYLPREALGEIDLDPGQLTDPRSFSKLRPIYRAMLDRTSRLLDSGGRYAARIPRRQLGLHLASRWPLELGRATVELLRAADNPLDPKRRIKVSRPAVYRILCGSVVRAMTR